MENNMILNDVWLNPLAPDPNRKHNRKCGHCQLVGHTIWDCTGVQRLTERLFVEAIDKIELNPLGYLLEAFIFSLTTPYLKFLYKRMCEKTMKKKEVRVYDEIFDAFKALDLGYPGRRERRTRIYSGAYRAVVTDVATLQHGHHLQTYLRCLSEPETVELYDKAYGDGGNWIGRNTELRERSDYGRTIRMFPTFRHYYIHCHFAEMNLGYDFSVIGFYANTLDRLRPIVAVPEVTIYLNKESSVLKMDMMANGHSRYNKCMNLKQTPVETEFDVDCAVCMETKSVKKHVVFNCKHDFCGSCVGRIMGGALRNSKDALCPLCRSTVTNLDYKETDVLVEMREIIIT